MPAPAGADIIMQLDDVVGSTVVDAARFEEATHRTTRWLDRCVAAHGRPTEQNLFAIVQGGLDPRLRDISLEARRLHPQKRGCSSLPSTSVRLLKVCLQRRRLDQ